VNEESISKTKVAQYVEKVLEDAGVSASVESVDFDTYAQKINDGEYSLFVGETTVSLNQDFDFLTRMVGYSNPEMDKVLGAFKEETDLEIKKQKATDVAKMFVDELPVISLYYQKNTLLTDGDIIGDFAPMQTRIIGDITILKAKK
jgi:ABC-type transport system substrate-binding protein